MNPLAMLLTLLLLSVIPFCCSQEFPMSSCPQSVCHLCPLQNLGRLMLQMAISYVPFLDFYWSHTLNLCSGSLLQKVPTLLLGPQKMHQGLGQLQRLQAESQLLLHSSFRPGAPWNSAPPPLAQERAIWS